MAVPKSSKDFGPISFQEIVWMTLLRSRRGEWRSQEFDWKLAWGVA
jgi:hypothetical protein